MLRKANLREMPVQTHLFIPANKTNEVLWILKTAGLDMNKIVIKQWRKVVKNQVPAIKQITEHARNAEIDEMYGENAKYVKTTPSVIISNYNPQDLFNELYDTLMGEGDREYIAYFEDKQSKLRSDDVDDTVGIQVMTKEE